MGNGDDIGGAEEASAFVVGESGAAEGDAIAHQPSQPATTIRMLRVIQGKADSRRGGGIGTGGTAHRSRVTM